MPTYQARELLLLPNLLSAARIPLALAFPFARGRTVPSLAILAAAGVTDVLDGYFARRLGQASPLGAMVDGVADKVFSMSVLGTLLGRGMLSPLSAALLASRELGELPLAARALARHEAHLVRQDRKANVLGKLATTLELGTLVAALLRVRHKRVLVAATAGLGVLAAFSYWRREVRSAARGAPPDRRDVPSGAEPHGTNRSSPVLRDGWSSPPPSRRVPRVSAGPARL